MHVIRSGCATRSGYARICLSAGLLGCGGLAGAVGLGQADVHSGLGAPLDISIPLTENTHSLTPDCISFLPVTNSELPVPHGAKISLEPSQNNPVRLRIQTTRAVNEPALNFSIRFACGDSLQRDYSILLDPVPIVPRHGEGENRSVPVVWPGNALTTQSMLFREPGRKPAKTHHHPANQTKNQIRKTAKPIQAAHQSSVKPQPQLRISGSTYAAASASMFALKLDTNLPVPGRSYANQALATALEDENTALKHKIAYLEQQLNRAQKNHIAPQQPVQNPVTTTSFFDRPFLKQAIWAFYLLGIVFVGAAIAWVLHRKAPRAETHQWRASPPALADTEMETDDVSRSVADLPAQHMESTKVLDSLQDEIEVLVAHQLDDLAIRRLEEEIQFAPAASLMPWLLLLDVLHREQKEEKYRAVRQACRLHFNLNIPVFGDPQATREFGLEFYAHVIARLVKLWPGQEAYVYLDDLLHDSRAGERMGFDLGVLQDVVFLQEIVKLINWRDSTARSGLESYPHILEHLSKFWFEPGVLGYLEELLQTNHGGDRIGFDRDTILDLTFLRDVVKTKQAFAEPPVLDFPEIRGLQY